MSKQELRIIDQENQSEVLPVNQRLFHQETQVPTEVLGKYLIFLTPDCPQSVRQQLLKISTEADMARFIAALNRLDTPSRRRVYLSGVFQAGEEVVPIFKQKAKKPNDPTLPGLNIEGFTTDVFHEMKTAYALIEILKRRSSELPNTLLVGQEKYSISYQVQKPWGAIVNNDDERQRFGVFEYIHGTSVRAETASYGGWNLTLEHLRKLFGHMSIVANAIANVVVEEGLEPWDFGVHQFIYSLDVDSRRITIGIVDTEEFNFSAEGSYWPESFINIGLPPVLIFASILDSSEE